MAGLLSVSFQTEPDLSKANNVIAIHGDKQQNERDWVLNEFKTGKSPVMVATDVASRGIGMIKLKPLPLTLILYLYSISLTSCDSGLTALLSLAMFVSMFDLSRLSVSFLFGSHARRTLELTMQCRLTRLLNWTSAYVLLVRRTGAVNFT